MGRIVVIASVKGGVGKTTTALNLGYALSQFAGRVLLVDADPQGGLSHASLLREKNRLGLIDVLAGRCDAAAAVQPTRDPRLAVVGVGGGDPEEWVAYDQAASQGALGRLIRDHAEGYDHVILDAPAGLGPIARALLAAADAVIVPLTCRNLAVRSLPALLTRIQQLAEGGSGARLDGILITQRDYRSVREVEVHEQIRRTLPLAAMFRTVIPFDDRFEEASMKGLPIAAVAGGERGAAAYFELATELASRAWLTRPMEGPDGKHLGLF
jgi:chromosome partitioning protein